MDAELEKMCDEWHENEITLDELQMRMIERRVRLNEQHKREKREEEQGNGAQP